MPFLELCVLPGRREVPEAFGGSGRFFSVADAKSWTFFHMRGRRSSCTLLKQVWVEMRGSFGR